MVPDDLYDHVQPVWYLGACRTLVSLIIRTTSKGRQQGSKESLLYSANSSDHRIGMPVLMLIIFPFPVTT